MLPALEDLLFSDTLQLKAYVPPGATRSSRVIAFDIDLESYQKSINLPTSNYFTLPLIEAGTIELSTTILKMYLKGLPSFRSFSLYQIVDLPTTPEYKEIDLVEKKLCEVLEENLDIMAEYTYSQYKLQRYRKMKESGMCPVLLDAESEHHEAVDVLPSLSQVVKRFKAVFQLQEENEGQEEREDIDVNAYTLLVTVASRVKSRNTSGK